MDAQLNLSQWSVLENSWNKAVSQGKQVDVTIRPIYEGSSKRPNMFDVEYYIDEKRFEDEFNNLPTGNI